MWLQQAVSWLGVAEVRNIAMAVMLIAAFDVLKQRSAAPQAAPLKLARAAS